MIRLSTLGVRAWAGLGLGATWLNRAGVQAADQLPLTSGLCVAGMIQTTGWVANYCLRHKRGAFTPVRVKSVKCGAVHGGYRGVLQGL